ncbi:discoidin domain-containing protein [Kitasatospora cinereorecta]|uniref:Discoidin domain-containing protein n=1 Tax=Kitasatospora cinereorecta TaxID=285560 RepID=A0ABW0VH40_9ACTN
MIKGGPYVIYTRMNLNCPNDPNDFATYSPDIDFLGYDPYTTDVATIQKNIHPDQRMVSVPENGPASRTGGPSNVAALMLGAYDAGTIHYATYQLAYEMNDSDPWNHITMVNLDHSNSPYAAAASNAVTQLGKDTELMSRNNGIDLGYFYSSTSTFATTKTLGPLTVQYSTAAESDQNDVYLMGLGASGTFTVTAPSAPSAASDGYFDAQHNWVQTGGSASFTDNGNGTYTVTASSTQFIRLTFASGLTTATVTASTNATNTGSPAAAIDGSLKKAYVSADNPSFPQTLTLNYTTPQNVSGVTVACEYCQGQGITQFDVQVSVDGSTNWTTVASSGTITYSSNSTTPQSRTVQFPAQLQVKGVRLVVHAANLQWHHYVVDELLPILDGPAYYYQIVNRNLGTYLNLQTAGQHVSATPLGTPAWRSAQWALSATSDESLSFSNRTNGDYLHNQDNLAYLEHGTPGNPSPSSAQWTFIPTDSGYAQLQSRARTSNSSTSRTSSDTPRKARWTARTGRARSGSSCPPAVRRTSELHHRQAMPPS